MKRIFDIIVSSLCAFLILCPLFIVIPFLIKYEDRGPVLYRETRIGRFGNSFKIFKFRTMVVDAEKTGGPSTADDDPGSQEWGNSSENINWMSCPSSLTC